MAEEKYFLVEVTETLQRTVKVKAETPKDAERIAKQGYGECLIELDAENLTDISFNTREVNEDDDLLLYEDGVLVDDGDVYWETSDESNEYTDEYDFGDYDYESTEPTRSCADCPPDECTGHCMSCWYRPV